MRRTLFASLVLVFCASAWSQASHWYDPAQPGHGVTVQAVGDSYVAQWYAHDGQEARWFASDVCDYGEPCPVFVTDAQGFPAEGAELVDAGEIVLTHDAGQLLLVYDISIRAVGCWQLPGPLPPQCRDSTGAPDSSLVLRTGFEQSGELVLSVLVE